jgi:dUTP diphosphatase
MRKRNSVEKVRVKIKRIDDRATLPVYAHYGPNGDLAADLCALESAHLGPGEVALIRTGLVADFPRGFGGIIEDRSGLALKGVCTLGGVIDPGYRGEIKIIVVNVGKRPVRFLHGDRIAQMRVVHRIEAVFIEAGAVTSSRRGVRGFGSTGLK